MKYAILLLLLAVCLPVSAQELPNFPCTCTSPADSINPHPRIRWADSIHSEEIYVRVPDASPALRKENVYASGLLRSRTVSVWQDSGWKACQRTRYTYAGKALTECLCQITGADGQWQDNFRYIFQFGDNQLIVSRMQQAWMDTAWQNLGLHSYKYNAAGQRENETFMKAVGAAWENVYQYRFTYNQKGEVSTRERINWEDVWDDGGFGRDVYQYDEAGDVQIVSPGQ